MYTRTLQKVILKRNNKHKAVVLIGARQVGKTTLIKEILKDKDYLFINGDDATTRTLFDNPNTEEIKSMIGRYKTVFIDEAQRINNIGLSIKIMIDQLQDVAVFVSGSSALYLQNTINESLTGRKWNYELFPISWEEFENKTGYIKSLQQLNERIVYGFYPEVLNNKGDEQAILNQLIDSYLYKDVLEFSGIRKPEVIGKLLKALAFQIANEVSYNELSKTVGIDKETVAKYIQILEQAYVIFRLPAFSRNLRNEIKKNQKIYFYDTGIRNAIISNFMPFDLRQDKGVLWENFLMAERLKQNKYKESFSKMYFWRTKNQQEVDLVETKDESISGYELKFKAKKSTKLSRTFLKNYQAKSFVIDKNNFRDFVLLSI